MIISQTVTDGTNIAIANKYEVAYDLSIGILTLSHSKGQDQGQAHFATNRSKALADSR